MKKFLALLLLLAGTLPGGVLGQNWTVFVPPERDFRALFPELPVRSTERDGSVAFKATVRDNDDDVYYTVYRLLPGFRPSSDARFEIQKRLQARVSDDEQGVQYDAEQNEDPGWDRYVFRHGASVSVNRLVENRGNYYELEVATRRPLTGLAIRTARDFFNSFQVTGFAVPTIAAVGGRLDAWCENRTDAFSLAFCKYSVCLQSEHERDPHCTALLRH
jgi:hypothetical protein